jgi:hypothetical protein
VAQSLDLHDGHDRTHMAPRVTTRSETGLNEQRCVRTDKEMGNELTERQELIHAFNLQERFFFLRFGGVVFQI